MYVCRLCPRGRVVGLATNQGSDPGSIPPTARTVPPPFVTPPPTRCTVRPLWLVRRDDFRAGRAPSQYPQFPKTSAMCRSCVCGCPPLAEKVPWGSATSSLPEPRSSTSVVVVFNLSDVGQSEPQLSALWLLEVLNRLGHWSADGQRCYVLRTVALIVINL